jgi:hypothetical protein
MNFNILQIFQDAEVTITLYILKFNIKIFELTFTLIYSSCIILVLCSYSIQCGIEVLNTQNSFNNNTTHKQR